MVVANRRQFDDSHDVILQEVTSIKKCIKQKHSYHEVPNRGVDEARISAEPGFSWVQEPQVFNRMYPDIIFSMF